MMTDDLSERQHYEKRRWRTYLAALALLPLVTIGEVAFYDRTELALLLYVTLCVTIGGGVYAWCVDDSRSRDFHLSRRYRWYLGMLGPISVPVYFWQTRGAREGAKSLFGLSLYAPFYGVFYATWYLAVDALTRLGYFSPR